jgi:hypothetical protein
VTRELHQDSRVGTVLCSIGIVERRFSLRLLRTFPGTGGGGLGKDVSLGLFPFSFLIVMCRLRRGRTTADVWESMLGRERREGGKDKKCNAKKIFFDFLLRLCKKSILIFACFRLESLYNRTRWRCG